MTFSELKSIVAEGENERVEFTVSTDKTDKYGEAICAFSNDLSDSKETGVFIVGVTNNGEIEGGFIRKGYRKDNADNSGYSFQRKYSTSAVI